MARLKLALVTGSSRGIGRAIASELARAGFAVAVHGSASSPHLRATFRAVQRINSHSICVVADLADPTAINCLFVEIQNVWGGLDVLVNNAAFQKHTPVLDVRLEDWDHVMAVNLRAAFLCAQRAGRMMKRRGGGRILNISSVHETAPRRYHTPYSTSKAGLSMLTKCLALELADYNIQANCLTVGPVATEMTNPKRQKILVPAVPAGRVGHPKEIAQLVRYLVSPAAAFITGSSVTIDGGILLGFCASRREL